MFPFQEVQTRNRVRTAIKRPRIKQLMLLARDLLPVSIQARLIRRPTFRSVRVREQCHFFINLFDPVAVPDKVN